MLSFNELYITEDGKNLVIDVSVDDLAAYSECYINKITINTADRHCTSKPGIDVFSGSTGTTYVDIDGDGVISESDVEKIDWLQSIAHRIIISEDYSKYDINKDGFIDFNDVALCIDCIKGDVPYSSDYDVSGEHGDGEVTIADVNAITDAILSLLNGSCIADECTIKMFDELKSRYVSTFQKPNAVISKGIAPVKRKRLCLSVADLAELGVTKSLSTLFIVRVEATIAGNASMVESLGCGWDENVITGVAYNGKPLYDAAVKYASSYGDTCESNDASAFTDFILRYYAFDFALRNGDICSALKYWNDYLGSSASVVSGGRSKGCGCHGTY